MRALALALAVCAAPAGATAQDASLAREYDRCVQLASALLTPDSLACWQGLRARDPRNPAVVHGLAVALRAVGRSREAADAFHAFLALAPEASMPASRVREARAAIDALERALGVLALTTTPADAQATIDGVATPRAAELPLDPGDRVLVVEAPGHAPITRRVHLPAGVRVSLHVDLPALATSGRLLVEAEPPSAAIAVDGAVAAHGRIDEAVTVGRHRVRVTAIGYDAFEREVEVAPGGRVSLRAELADVRPVTARTWFRVAVGVGVAAVVAGAVVGGIHLFSSTAEPFRGALYDLRPMGP